MIFAKSSPEHNHNITVRAAFDALGGIIGEAAGDEILDEVFSRFCLGK